MSGEWEREKPMLSTGSQGRCQMEKHAQVPWEHRRGSPGSESTTNELDFLGS